MADCSKTEVFLKEWERMRKSFDIRGEKLPDCEECPIAKIVGYDEDYACNALVRCPNEVLNVVQKWSNEHPLKTRQSELLKMFPNLGRWHNERGESYINFCPKSFDSTLKCRKDG